MLPDTGWTRSPAHDAREMTRPSLVTAVLIAGLVIGGGLSGLAARHWSIGGFKRQQAQLERCILTSRQLHVDQDTRSKVAYLDAEVPACMNSAGYEPALRNGGCSPALWQGDVFCYLPKSPLRRLIYRIGSYRTNVGGA